MVLSFYDMVICLSDKRKTVGIVYLGFSKVFGIISLNIVLEKLAAPGLDRCFFTA